MYDVIRELIENEQIPDFYEVEYRMPYQKADDPAGALEDEVRKSGLLSRILPGDRVAITAGSRGISNIVAMLRRMADLVKERGAVPYIVAAMGSHGGATGEGQRAILADYGITEKSMGCEIVSEMDVTLAGVTPSGLNAYIDSFAASCDKIIVMGRVKAHTDFHGPVESGLAKMITIGLGKEQGADTCHKLGFDAMSKNVREIADVILEKMPVAFGLAIVEDAFHNTAFVQAVAAEDFARVEPGILKRSKELMPVIPYPKIDILIVDEIGKNISGAGMDPNVTGRSPRLGISSPFAERIVVRDISPQSHGAGTGIGNADAITRKAYEHFSFETTYPNAIASKDPESVKIPVVMPGDKEAIQFVINSLTGARDTKVPRIVWIHNTNDLGRIRVTEPLLDQTEENSSLSLMSGPLEVIFDDEGYVLEFRERARS